MALKLPLSLLLALALIHVLVTTTRAQTNCSWSTWSGWSMCQGSTNCSYGTQTRSRMIIAPATNNGSCTGSSNEVKSCNLCAIDCSYSRWSTWSNCSAGCDGGVSVRSRTIRTQAAYGGAPCDQLLVEAKTCNTESCSNYCMWNGWTEWTPCSAKCAGGLRYHNRTQLYNPLTNVTLANARGVFCNFTSVIAEVCNAWDCLDCIWGEWSLYSPCSVDCGGGVMKRQRAVIQELSPGGEPCDGSSYDFFDCNMDACYYVPNENDGRQTSMFVIVMATLGAILGFVVIALGVFLILLLKRRAFKRHIIESQKPRIELEEGDNEKDSELDDKKDVEAPKIPAATEKDQFGKKFARV